MTTPDGSSLEQVRAEVRATWCGRFRWVWRGAAVLLVLVGLLMPAEGFNGFWFFPLVGLSSWLPAIACSDLLSLGFKANPHPQREWPASAILNRAVGRLAPLFAAEVLWVSAYTLRSLIDYLHNPGTFNPAAASKGFEVVLHWAVWTFVFLMSGLPYAATAALLSSLFRKPKRWLVTPTVILTGMAVAAVLQWAVGPIVGGKGSMPDGNGLLGFVLSSGFFIGLESVIGIMRLLESAVIPETVREMLGSFPSICLIASAVFAVYTGVIAVWIRVILCGRLGRHPYTLSQSEEVAAIPGAGI